MRRTHGGNPVPSGKHSVQRGGGATTLDMSKHGDPRLKTSTLFDLLSHNVADSTESGVSVFVDGRLGYLKRSRYRNCSLRNYHYRGEAPSPMPSPEGLTNRAYIKRHLWNQHYRGATGDPGPGGYVPHMTAHHLNNNHSIMGLCCGVKSVDRISRSLYRGVETEGPLRPVDVVVDGLGYTNQRYAIGVDSRGSRERPLSSDDDQRINAVSGHGGFHPLNPVIKHVGLVATRPQNGASAGQKSSASLNIEWHPAIIEQAAPTVEEPDNHVAVFPFGLAHDASDHRVQTRTIASTGEHPNFHSSDATNR